ncbi:MAG: hypothetical protein QHH07_05855 [Sedimentisphaerales bacterium]|nr:hypothetical protein [Sedimentisphaerales bacterium]
MPARGSDIGPSACGTGSGGPGQADPYLWLEQIEGKKAMEWVVQRSQATVSVLQTQPLFEQIRQKALEIYNSDKRIPYASIMGMYTTSGRTQTTIGVSGRGRPSKTTSSPRLDGRPCWVFTDSAKRRADLGSSRVLMVSIPTASCSWCIYPVGEGMPRSAGSSMQGPDSS